MKLTLTLMFVMMATLVIGCESTEKTDDTEMTAPETTATTKDGVTETSTASTRNSSEVIYIEPTTPTATPTPTPTPTPQPQPQPHSTMIPGPAFDGIPMGPGPVLDNAQPGGAYIIKKGDTLFSIAKRVYGDGSKWRAIQAANPGIVPTKLRIGQQINLPQ